MDLTIASALLVLLSPIAALIAYSLFVVDGRVIYRQKRVGRYGQIFTMYKFVSMVPNSEGSLAVNRTDCRITPIGRLIRRFALDEIPQLVNVLKADMSMVGPRPMPLWEHDECRRRISGWRDRLSVKPGIVGLAQLRVHRGAAAEKLRYDRMYIERQTIFLDLYIIGMGIVNSLKGRWI